MKQHCRISFPPSIMPEHMLCLFWFCCRSRSRVCFSDRLGKLRPTAILIAISIITKELPNLPFKGTITPWPDHQPNTILPTLTRAVSKGDSSPLDLYKNVCFLCNIWSKSSKLRYSAPLYQLCPYPLEKKVKYGPANNR